MPCSNWSFVAFSPTFAKWPLTVITDGAVGCLLLTGGRFSFPLGNKEVGCDDMVEGVVQGYCGDVWEKSSNGRGRCFHEGKRRNHGFRCDLMDIKYLKLEIYRSRRIRIVTTDKLYP